MTWSGSHAGRTGSAIAARATWSPSFSSRWTLDPVAVEAVEALEPQERLVERLALASPTIDAWRIAVARRRLDPVQDKGVGHLLDQVDDVVETADQAR